MTGIWETADTITKARMNEKTIFQGTGSAISGLASTYSGMLAFCTSSGSGFVAEILYQRNSANTAWSSVGIDQLPYLTLSTTIGDYSYPASAVVSSNGSLTSITDSFTGWLTQAEADFWYPSSNTAKARVNITNDLIDFNDDGSYQLSRDLQAVSDTAFVLKFKLTVSTVTHTGGTGMYLSIGLSSADYNTSRTATQDSISLMLYGDNLTRPYYANAGDGASMGSEATGTAFGETVTAGDVFWVKIERTSATSATISLYSDAYTTLVEAKTITIPSTIQGLRYFVIKSTSGGTFVITVDDLECNNLTYNNTIFMLDGSDFSAWTSSSSANPNAYFDLTTDREIVGLALKIDRTLTTVNSLKIRASTDTTFTDGENIAYVNISDFTDDTWRFLANNFLADNRRYIQIYSNETGVLSINEIKVRYGISDLNKILGHKHRTRTVTSADIFTDSN